MDGPRLPTLLDEPRPARPPVRVWRDWVLVAVVVVGSGLELAFRDDRAWLTVVAAVSLVVGGSLLWRRTRPLAAVATAFGTLIVFDLARVVALDTTGLLTIAAALILPYALLRWGSGREAAVGLTLIGVWLAVTHAADPTPPAEVVAGYGFFLFSAALGASVRFHASTRQRDIERARLQQRHELARELHDAVGHHVSGIAVQAQAGQAVAAAEPERAVAALATIEQAASQALAEMRAIVGVLRDGSEPERAPQPAVADLERLARAAGRPRVEVHRSGALDDLPAGVGVALYRIAQEALTNVVRHAPEATEVAIEVDGDGERVRLTVRDDGPLPATPHPAGFGLLGMEERAALLGGTLQAGPGRDAGWVVQATLPIGEPVRPQPHVPDVTVER